MSVDGSLNKKVAVFHPVPIFSDGEEFTSNSITFRSILMWSSCFSSVDLVTFLHAGSSARGKHRVTRKDINVIGLPVPEGRRQLYLTKLLPLLVQLVRTIWKKRRAWDVVVLFDAYLLNILAYCTCRMFRIPVSLRMVGRYDLFIRESLRYEGAAKRLLGSLYGRLTESFEAHMARRGLVVTDGDFGFAPPQMQPRIGFSVESSLRADEIVAENPYPEKAPGRPPLLLTVGRVHPAKGIHVLVDAVAAIVDDGVDVELDIVGPAYGERYGNYEHKLRRQVDEVGRGRIRFHGWLDDGEAVEALWQRCDVLVVPCVSNADGVPRVIFEAMARGIPVIATRIGGIGRVIAHGRTGMLVPPDDSAALGESIRLLTTSTELRMSISRQAHRCARAFTAEAVSRRLALMLSAAAENLRRKDKNVNALSEEFPFNLGDAP
jgi:glycosyltransferase involved in cell wall biosynthesis